MSAALAPHIRFAEVGEHIITLDLRADRFRRLGPGLAAALRSGRDGLLTPDAQKLLHAAGLLCEDGVGRPFRAQILAPATSAALSDRSARPDRQLQSRAIAALLSAHLRLRVGGLEAAIDRASRLASPERIGDPEYAAHVARAFDSARCWWPVRRKCLPDGLALHALLQRMHLPATLIIGVRAQPFAAHCWVQSGACLLTDTLDEIAELKPILIV